MVKKGSASEDLHCVDGIIEGVGLRVGPFESVRRVYRGWSRGLAPTGARATNRVIGHCVLLEG